MTLQFESWLKLKVHEKNYVARRFGHRFKNGQIEAFNRILLQSILVLPHEYLL